MHKAVARARNERGFTLIELLIVIVVLGILASIVVFAVGNATDDAKESSCDADVKTLEVALEAYKAQHDGDYPSGADSDAIETVLSTADADGNKYLKGPVENANAEVASGVATGEAVPDGCS